MVTDANITAIISEKNGYLVGLKRRRNKKLNKWLDAVDEAKWISCPVGITAQEKTNPPRTRAQEVPSGIEGMRVIIVDSDERRDYEVAMRQKSMDRTRQATRETPGACCGGKTQTAREDRRSSRATPAADSRLSLLFVGHRAGSLPLLRERQGLEKRDGYRRQISHCNKRDGLERGRSGVDLQGVERRRERISPSQRRAGGTTDLSSGRRSSKSAYIRSCISSVGPAIASSSTRTSGD